MTTPEHQHEMPTVSAVIPFYGDPIETMPLVDALREQSLHEIIVADDCSPHPFPPVDGVKIVRASANAGFGSTVNLGAAQASGEKILILNSDLSISDNFVTDLLAAAEPWQPAVVSPALREHGRLVATGKRWPSLSRAFCAWLTPLARLRDTPLWNRLVGHYDTSALPAQGAGVDWVVGACMLVPTSDFRDVGGFDERFFMNSEEIDLQRRLSARGIRTALVPSVEVEHAGGGSSDPTRRRQWVVDGQFRYAAKWAHPALLAAMLLAASTLNFAWNLVRRLRGVPVRPWLTLREECSLVTRGYRARRGRSVPNA